MECPAFAPEVTIVAAIGVGRVADHVGVVVEGSQMDREELMTRFPSVVRTLKFRIDTYLRIVDGFLNISINSNNVSIIIFNDIIMTTESAMLLDLLQTVCTIEESPAEEVEAMYELTTELLRTLNVCNLLEEFVGITSEVREVQVG